MTLELRTATAADASAAGRICHDAFKTIADQHGFPPDFPSRETATGLFEGLISRPEVHGLIAEVDGHVAGSNFLWEGDPVAGIGPITVAPGLQNATIGRRLMQRALERAKRKGFKSVRLVQAAYHTRSLSLYTKLGFVAREPLAVLQGTAPATRIDGYEVRSACESDLALADTLSRRVHGYARGLELGNATVVERGGRVTGYASDIGFFGHAVAETTPDLIALIAAAHSYSGPGFLAPIRNTALFRWCLERGLRVVQPMTLMTMGEYREPDGAFLPSILY